MRSLYPMVQCVCVCVSLRINLFRTFRREKKEKTTEEKTTRGRNEKKTKTITAKTRFVGKSPFLTRNLSDKNAAKQGSNFGGGGKKEKRQTSQKIKG